MAFTEFEKEKLLATHMVGPKVIERLEAIGLDSFAKLKEADARQVCQEVADHFCMSCWVNAMAIKAIENAIETAQ